ncbi:MAG: SCP2 sterol-binding domain-containing protein [Proteobacteria bacterium]|nr:SCP2 sterol-binding domain-containing protein [Pseudomonadota bacterium]
MATTQEFFANHLPKKLVENPGLAKEIGAVYQFDIDGAGIWTLDLTGDDGGSVSEGAHADPGCVVSISDADFNGLLDGSANAMTLFITGKLAVTDAGLAMSLQKILN